MKMKHQITALAVLLAFAGCSPSDQTGKENQTSNPAPAADARAQQKDTSLAAAPDKEVSPAPPLAANPAPPAEVNAPSLGGKPDSPPPTAAPTVPGPEAKPPAALANTPPETKDEFITAMTKKLADLDTKIAELAQKSEGLKDDAKVQADQALATLRGQRDTVKQKFDEAKAATSDVWKDFKAGVEVAMNQLETAYENAKSKFN
jgi:hypothetical protein